MKSGALVLVLAGDCAQSIGLLTGARRYYKHLNLIWFDRDADLNTPATTPSGRIDGMVVAHIVGRGAPELVRFWGETPLVREPDVLLYGISRLDPPEQEVLAKSPLRHITAEQIAAKGAEKSASDALTQSHADTRDFILHLDVDVISGDELPAVNVPANRRPHPCPSPRLPEKIRRPQKSPRPRHRPIQPRQRSRRLRRQKNRRPPRRSPNRPPRAADSPEPPQPSPPQPARHSRRRAGEPAERNSAPNPDQHSQSRLTNPRRPARKRRIPTPFGDEPPHRTNRVARSPRLRLHRIQQPSTRPARTTAKV